MFKRGQMILTFIVLFSLLLAACAPVVAPAPALTPAPKEEAPAPKEAAPPVQGEPVDVGGTATGVPYEMKESVFNGNPITLVIWDWHTPRVNYWKEITPRYTKMYPNVTFEIVQVPGEDYWKKLMAAIPAGEGPDIFHFHNAQHTPFIKNNLIDPFPEDLFLPSFYKENYVGMKEGHFMDADGHIRYIPYGSMAAELYINTKMWEEAGLTENDYPKTWDDLLIVAKKLTKYDASGNIDVAGFAFNGYIQYLWNDMLFQQGRYMYTKDGRGCQVDNPESINALRTITKFYDENINSRQFLEWIEAFGTQKAAMVWAWTWFTGYMKATYPDISFKAIRMPSFTGENLPALGRQNYEVSLVVNPRKDIERRKVAWDFLHWLYSDDEKLVDLALMHNIAPAYTKLNNHPRILADATIADLSKSIPYKVFPGEFPTSVDQVFTQYVTQNIMTGTPIEQVVQQAQQACDQALQEQQYWIVERTYAHDDKMIPNQP
ncbi:MAG: extracellular solute-binding protein [Anaerolineae bacterium]|nr:extracellular solute-binding protein [Anaerolineae bacterium]